MSRSDKQYETIVQVMARSESKRIKDKNIYAVAGHPLLAWSIRLAQLVPSVDRVIINTDSELYADVARDYGAEALFLRPKELAGDKTSLTDVMHHAIWSLRSIYGMKEGDVFNAKLITFFPTSPFRNADRMESMIQSMGTYKWVSTCVETDASWDDYCLPNGRGMERIGRKVSLAARDMCFCKGMGNFSGITLRKLDKHKLLYKLHDPIECVDIDTMDDLKLMERIIDNRLYDFGGELW